MSSTKKFFALGLMCGLLVACGGFYAFGQRYRIVPSGPGGYWTIRLDSWSGQSWMMKYYEKEGGTVWWWSPMAESN